MKRPLLLLGFALPLLAGPIRAVHAQEAPSAPAADGQRIRVFLDCQYSCDFDYLRTELRFVDYVRDRQDADVHILVTPQTTGAGGRQYTLQFVGLKSFQDVADEIRFSTLPTDSEDQIRQAMARTLKGGLVRYAMRTPLGERLQLSFGDAPGARPGGAPAAAGRRDPWNNWVFRTRLGGFTNGESSYGSHSLDASVSANRTTDEWKTTFSISTRYRESNFEVGNNTVTNLQRDHNVSALAVKSLTDHWSIGGRSNANHSTFLNRDLSLRLAPAIEYNIFPYSESTRRQLTLQYSVGMNQLTYAEVTIYGKTEEQLVDQMLTASYGLRQRWGSVGVGVTGSHYLHDTSKSNLQGNAELELRLFRGVGLTFFGYTQRIRDQLHLAAGGLTPEQILLRQRQIATAFRYYGSVGLSYSFGSITNNVVNPRMGGSRGGGVIFF